jgi:hypothetical protein
VDSNDGERTFWWRPVTTVGPSWGPRPQPEQYPDPDPGRPGEIFADEIDPDWQDPETAG